MDKNIEKWMNTAEELLKKLYESRRPGICRYIYGDPQGCEKKEFNDSEWDQVLIYQEFFERFIDLGMIENCDETVKTSVDWALEDGPITFRKHLQIPDVIEGISTEGTDIRLWLEMLNSIQIYVDGDLIAEYEYWADSRRCELTLCERYETGKEQVVTFKIPRGEGDAHILARFKIGVVEDRILQLSTAIEQVRFACRIAGFHKQNFQRVLEELEKILDIKCLIDRNWDEIDNQFQEIDSRLKQVDGIAKSYIVHIVGHAHLDMDWLWSYKNTVETCLNDVRTICNILDEFPDFRYSMSQAGMYEIVEKNDSALFERVKEKIRNGQWEVTAAAWVENDLNMVGGDYIIRQIKLAADYAVEHLETNPSEIFFEPDCFGHPATMPDILAKAGVKYYYHMRCPKEEGLYWWQGKGGQRVLDFSYGNYANEMTPPELMKTLYKMIDSSGLHQTMFMFGIGDHGGGPSRKDICIKKWLDTKPGLPTLKFSTSKEFFESVQQEKTDFAVHVGEQNFTFEGTYTLKSRIKKAVRDSERVLLDTEAILAHFGTVNNDSYKEILKNSWKSSCFLGFHDIIAGCNTSHADEYHMELTKNILDEMEKIKYQCAQDYFDSDNEVITVLNQLGFERRDVVKISDIEIETNDKMLIDEAGNAIEYQYRNRTLCFVDRIPGFSTKSYRFVKNADKREQGKVKVIQEKEIYCLENEYISLKVSKSTGAIISLWDKQAERWVLKENILAPAYSFPHGYRGQNDSNIIRIEKEEPHYWGAWVLGNVTDIHFVSKNPEIKIVEEGPVKATLCIRHTFENSWFEQYLSVYSGLKKVDFSLRMNWQELGNQKTGIPVAKVEFTMGYEKSDVFYEIPMGEIKRPVGSEEYPAYRYVKLCNKNSSCVFVSDYKHGFEMNGDKLRMTVVRSSYSPDRKPDEGEMETRYSLEILAENASEAEAVKQADSFDRPFVIFRGIKKSAACRKLSVNSDKIVITAVKPSESGQGITAYMRNTADQEEHAVVQAGEEFLSMMETDITERNILQVFEVQNGRTEMSFRPFEIKTLILA